MDLLSSPVFDEALLCSDIGGAWTLSATSGNIRSGRRISITDMSAASSQRPQGIRRPPEEAPFSQDERQPVADHQSKKTWQFLALFPPPKLFWANVGPRPVARANVYSCGPRRQK